jgi:hypothetical protein
MLFAMTLAIAIAGLVLSVLALAASLYQWRHSGPSLVLRASCTFGYVGPEDDLLKVEVISAGRLPVTISRVDLCTDYPRGYRPQGVRGPLAWLVARLVGGYGTSAPLFVEDLPVVLAPSEALEREAHLFGPLMAGDKTYFRARTGGRWFYSNRIPIRVPSDAEHDEAKTPGDEPPPP